MDSNDSIVKFRPSLINNFVKRSLSSIGISTGNQNLPVREAKSFTGAIEELKIGTTQEINQGESINCYNQIYMDVELYPNQLGETGYVTREVMSNQIFLVKEEMLTYRGQRYSLNDIASKWKKDCRMWLWKNKQKRNKSLGELRYKLQNMRMQ